MRAAAQRPDGRMRAIVSRFAEGRPLGSFRYEGTRPDDPNDIHPHEHRRELRGNRVFAAWLNHDDSRGLNSLDMLEERGGRQTVRHYMFDFGSIMGSGTIRAQSPRAGNEYILEWTPGLLDRPLARPLLQAVDADPLSPTRRASVGRFEGAAFRPETWRPEYPNTAFDNMRPEDAFWAARIVARFDERESARDRRRRRNTPIRAPPTTSRQVLIAAPREGAAAMAERSDPARRCRRSTAAG